MVSLKKLKSGEVSLSVNNMGTVRFSLSDLSISTKGFSVFNMLEEVVCKANKTGSIYWSACPRNVARSNKSGINNFLEAIDSDKDLKKLVDDVIDTLEDNFKGRIITVTNLKSLSGIKNRKWLDLNNLATRQELDYFVCTGKVVKRNQADESADEKKSCNKYFLEQNVVCPYLKYNDKLGCVQCACNDFKSIIKGDLRK